MTTWEDYINKANEEEDKERPVFTSGSFRSGITLSGNLVQSSGTIQANQVKLDGVTLTTVQTGSESFADNDTSVMTSAAIQDKIEAYGYSTTTGDITGVTAGSGLSGGGTSGGVSLAVADLAVSHFAGATIQTGSESFVDNDTTIMTSAAIQDKIEAYGYSTTTGDITGVTAGTGLSGGGASGAVTLNVSGVTLSEIAGASVITSSETFADNDTTVMTSAAIQDKIEAYGYTTATGDITGVTAGTGLSGGGASGAVTLNVSNLTVSEFAGASIQTGSESFADDDTSLMTSAAIQDKIEGYGYTTATGDITGVTAGTALTGGGSSGAVTLNFAPSELSAVTIAADDKVVVADTSDSDNPKTVTTQAIRDLTSPNQVAFRVSNTTGGAGALANSVQTIVFGSDSGGGLYDNGNNYNTSTGIFTAPVDGYYFFTFTVWQYTTYDNDTNLYYGIAGDNGWTIINHGAKGYDGGKSVSCLVQLDATDRAWCAVTGGAGANYDLNTWLTETYNTFQGFLVG